MPRVAVGVDDLRLPVADTVQELDLAAAENSQPGDHLHGIAEADGVAVAALQVGDGEVEAGAGNLRVGHPRGFHPGDASGLEPDDILAVVDDAHLVGLGEADGDVQRDGGALDAAAHSDGDGFNA